MERKLKIPTGIEYFQGELEFMDQYTEYSIKTEERSFDEKDKNQIYSLKNEVKERYYEIENMISTLEDAKNNLNEQHILLGKIRKNIA